MLQVPAKLLEKYQVLLRQNHVPGNAHRAYIKWLRYYLDFCKKYKHGYADRQSLVLFIEKPKSKKQIPEHREQALRAVELYYSGLGSKPSVAAHDDHVEEPARPYRAGEEVCQWDKALETLGNEIRVRHYSPKTLKSYSLWAKKLRHHTGDKDPEALMPDDVKAFLTALAVEKKISASSQNQAFNALLFFFRHVLNKEFGKMDGVVRANENPISRWSCPEKKLTG